MQATDFELRNPTLLRHLLVGAALATYSFDSDDVVWRFIKASPERRSLEHVFFLLAALFTGIGAFLCTRAGLNGKQAQSTSPASPRSRAFQWKNCGEWLYAIGLASLFPLAGAVILVLGESLRTLRLLLHGDGVTTRSSNAVERPQGNQADPQLRRSRWTDAIRREAAKWGLTLTMVVFSITLIDRVAEWLAVLSLLAWALLNLPLRRPEISA